MNRGCEKDGVEIAREAAARAQEDAQRRRSADAWRFSRRALLGGLGCSAAFLPLLAASRTSFAATAPKRFLFIQWTNGVLTRHYWPSGGETGYTLADTTQALAPHREQLIFLGGVDLKSAKADPYCGAGHQSLPHLLTGSASALTDITGGDPGSRGIGNAISVDQAIANAINAREGSAMKPLTLGIMTGSQRPSHGYISFRGPAKSKSYPDADKPEGNPYNAFKAIFGGGAMPAANIDALRARRKSVLDVVGKGLERMRKNLGADDRQRVDEHLTVVRSIEKDLDAAAGPGNAAMCGGDGPQPAGVNLSDRSKYPDIAKLHFDLVTLAFKCDVTRVATVMFSNSNDTDVTFTFLGGDFTKPSDQASGVGSGSTVGHHEIAHGAGDGDSPLKIAVDKWYLTQFAGVVDRFKKTTDATGAPLLDRSLVVFSNHMGVGASHNIDNIPIIMAGSAGGYYKTGRWLKLGGVAHNGLLASWANAMDVPTTSFGDKSFNTFSAIDPRLRG